MPHRTLPASSTVRREQTLRLVALAVLLAAFALRLHRLGTESLWYDETVSAYLASLPSRELIAHTAGDIHPPGYYLLLRAWTLLSAPSLAHGLEFLLVWPSLVCGLLVVALLLPIGRRLFDPHVALAAAAIAAIHPFQLWYSQEVRMYTPAAALGLACLWSLLNAARAAQESGSRRRELLWLSGYAIFAALGFYTLYYFAFLLIALNAIYILLLLRQTAAPRTGPLIRWLLAQVAVAILWLPWLPTFVRQATDPPVPPWRNAWASAAQAASALAESLATLLLGHDAPFGTVFAWALVAAAVTVGAVLFAVARQKASHPLRLDHTSGVTIALIYSLVPIGCIWLASLFVTPLYHVRYLYTYSPLFLVVVSYFTVETFRRSRVLGGIAAAGLVILHGSGLSAFWYAPHNRTDDHRAAVSHLAEEWRSGDAILANAGWVYPALVVYWPVGPSDLWPAIPPPLTARQRLTAFLDQPATEAQSGTRPTTVPLVVTGSIDGSPSLGWGSPHSDFYAISWMQTETALDALSQRYQRLWHYRLYDTVSDPDGQLRDWLATHTTQIETIPYPGRDYLAVELYAFDAPMAPPQSPDPVAFSDSLILEGFSAPTRIQAGSILYANLHWRAASRSDRISALKVSLRLYDGDHLIAQSDRPLTHASNMPTVDARDIHRVAVPVPWTTPPGDYSLEVVIYDGETLQPLTPDARSSDGQRFFLNAVDVTPRN